MAATISRPEGRVRRRGLAEYGAALACNGLTIAAQLVSLVLATAALSLAEVGFYLAIAAMSAMALPLIGAGSADLLTAEIARAPASAPRYVGLALARAGWTFVVLALPVAWVQAMLLGEVELWAIFVLNANLLLFGRIVSIAENTEIAFGRAATASGIRLVYAVLQLAAFAALFLVPLEQRFGALVWFTTAAGLGAACVAIGWLLRPYLKAGLPSMGGHWRESVHYMTNQVLGAATANLDRVLAAVVLEPAMAAIYVVASRAAQIAATPVVLSFRSSYHRFFAIADAGDPIGEAVAMRALLWQSVGLALGTALLANIAFALATASVMPGYAAARLPFAIVTASLPFVAIYYCCANQLTAHRRLLARNAIDAAAVVLLALAVAGLFGQYTAPSLALALLVARAATAGLAWAIRSGREGRAIAA